MTPYRETGRRIWTVKVPREGGAWRGYSTRSFHAATAKRMQEMIDELGPRGVRAWDILGRIHNGSLTLPELYDEWTRVRGNVAHLRLALRDTDLEPTVDQYLAAAGCSEDTKAHYRVHLRRLIPEGERYSVGQLTVARIQQAIDDMKGQAGTKRKAAAAIRSYCNWLISRGVLETNPVRDVRLPKAPKPRTQYLDTPDAIELADAQASPYRELSALLAGTGIEVSVALKLRRRDVDVDNREIRAAGTKTHARDRVVRVAEWAWSYVLKAAKGKLPDTLLFDGIPDRWEAGDVHRAAIEKLKEKSSVFAGYTMRDHRHTYAVRAIRAGTPAELVARQLGHANAVLVHQVYGRFAPGQSERDKWEKIATAQDKERAKEAGK